MEFWAQPGGWGENPGNERDREVTRVRVMTPGSLDRSLHRMQSESNSTNRALDFASRRPTAF